MRFNDDEQNYHRLIKNAQLSNSDEFEKLYHRYWPLVRRLWQQYKVDELEFADWEQEAQIVMLEVVRLYNHQGPRMFSCFFKQSLTNRIRDLQRQAKAHKRIPADRLYILDDDYANSLTDYLHQAPDEVIYCHQSLVELVDHCSNFEKEVLYYLHCGHSIAEITVLLGCSKRSIQSALNRCRLKLIQMLTE